MASPQKTILIVEDEPHIAMGLRDSLEFEGFRVLTASQGQEGIHLFKYEKPDAILLDLMLPDMNGYVVCEEIRKSGSIVPIIMLTARSQETDKIRGLNSGADDYMTKPFSVNELVARIRAVFRRIEHKPAPDLFQIGEAKVNFLSQTVFFRGHEYTLGYYEMELLKLLVDRLGLPVTREEILEKIWGMDANPTNRTVDNFIVKLRKKIEPQPDKPLHILTAYGVGYKLVVDQANE